MDSRLRYLADRDEIDTVLSTYCRGIDRHDVGLINSAYFADAHDNHGPFQDRVGNGFAEWGNAIHAERTRAHLHHRTTKSVQIEGEKALADTYVIFSLYLRQSEHVQFGFGRYIDRLERRSSEWRIADRQTTIDIRMLGDAACFAELNASSSMSAGAYPEGSWDRQDLSYHYPFDLPQELRGRLEAKGPRPSRAEPVPATDFEDVSLTGEALIQRLYDRQMIADVIADSLRGLDRRSVSLATRGFAPDARVALRTHEMLAQEYARCEIDAAKQEDVIQARNMTTHLTSFGGVGAASETYVIELRRRLDGRQVWVAGVRMLDELVCEAEIWLIRKRTLVRDWEFLSQAANFNPADGYLRSASDPADPFMTDRRDQEAAL